DDAGSPPRLEQVETLLGDHERGHRVGAEHVQGVVEAQGAQALGGIRASTARIDARVVDQEVEGARATPDRGVRGPDRGGVRDVERHHGELVGVVLRQRVEVPRARRLAAGGEDLVAALQTAPGEREPQAAAGAGDQDAPDPARRHSRRGRDAPCVGIASAPGAAFTTGAGRAWVGIRSSRAVVGGGVTRAGRGVSTGAAGRTGGGTASTTGRARGASGRAGAGAGAAGGSGRTTAGAVGAAVGGTGRGAAGEAAGGLAGVTVIGGDAGRGWTRSGA